MALAADIVWELRASATAGNVNGGGFKTGASGTDYSQQDAAQYALTGVTSAGAGDTFLTASAAANMVGNVCRVVSGTNFTAGWYEIIAVSVGVSVQVDRAVTTGVGAAGVINIGGAMSMNSTLDDDLFEVFIPGNTVYIKSGTYGLGETVSVGTGIGTAAAPINVIGYNATRGDNPTGSSRPLLACAAFSFTFGTFTNISNLILTGTAASVCTVSTGGSALNVKSLNSSTTPARTALSGGVSDCTIINCEAVSQNGIASSITSRGRLIGSYLHDSDVGIQIATSGPFVQNCLIESNKTAGIQITATTNSNYIANNTIYGSEAKIGTGISLANNTQITSIINNIIYGHVTGVSQATAQIKSNMGWFNNFNNNTTNATNYTLSSTDTTSNPTFTSASQLTGSTATTSGSVLTQSGGDFSTVTDNVDYLRVVSGTGVAAGIYLITAHTATTLTVNNTLGTSSGGDVVWVVPVNHNLSIGTNLKAAAFPGLFPGSETTGYMDTGAVQRQEPTGGGSFTFTG